MSYSFDKHAAKIHANFDRISAYTQIELDGKLVDNVESFSLSQKVGEIPILRLGIPAKITGKVDSIDGGMNEAGLVPGWFVGSTAEEVRLKRHDVVVGEGNE